MSDLKPLHQMVSSCTGAVITAVFMTPFDVVKVRLQAQQRAELSRTCFLYCNGLMDHICKCAQSICTHPERDLWYNRPVQLNGTLDAFVKISKQEGIQSLWAGLPPTLIVAIPNTVIYFTTYEQLRAAVLRYLPGDRQDPPSWAGGVAGGLARIWSVSVVSPFELIRTKMQAQSISYKELVKTLQMEITNTGIISLWKGWVPTILRDVPFSVMYWYSYEMLKTTMNQQQPTIHFSMFAGAVSGGIAGALTLPLDVIKTHRQIEIANSKSSSTKQMLLNIYKLQGMKGLFSGLVPRLAKVMPACAIMISTYEYAKRFFRNHNQLDSVCKE
ncbi:solute carrier family 25 member 40-like isoform X2 [Homarus americanus]|uniref:solute carrier family 25 member 40-like isoform X2 n=1 Tax=Homarus americanus TaxID=6706 RepID=UPI001C43AE7B|nr:solute carrier family 25 member 40-like isoform X2 [Homarus americanus]